MIYQGCRDPEQTPIFMHPVLGYYQYAGSRYFRPFESAYNHISWQGHHCCEPRRR